jgi:predicted phosphodiesterase
MVMAVKAKYIKDLPLKKTLDGSESLLVQDSNGTQQASLEVIVDKVKQNSQEEIREVENELKQKLNKNDIVTMANMGQDVKEAMTGGSVAVVGPDAVGAVNITNNSIGINKLNFTRVTNYINVDNISYNTIVSIETGKTLNDTRESDTQSITEVMECRPNETYTIDINTAGETTYVLFGDEGYNVLSYVQLTKNADGSSPTTFTVPKGAYYMRLRFASEKVATAMLYKGTVIPNNYEKHSIEIPYLKLDEDVLLDVREYVKEDIEEAMTRVVGPDAVGAVNITNQSIGVNKLNFARITNYINVDNITYNTIISVETGKTLNDIKESNAQCITEIIECRPNETYAIDINTAGETTYVLFGDEWYNVLSYVQLVKNADGSSPTTFTIPTGAYYMRIRFLSEKASTAMLYKGTVIPDNYEKHSIEIPYLKLDENSLLEVNKYVKEKELKLKDKNIRFMIVSDLHYGKDDTFGTYRERFELLINTIIEKQCEKPFDFIIMHGDITQFKGTDEYFESVKNEFLWRIPCPIFAVKGNHDVVSEDLWIKTFGYNTQYSFETEDFYFICLDVYHKRTYLSNGKYEYNGVDYDYFESELRKAQATGKKIVVIQHELVTSIDTNYYSVCKKYGVFLRIVGHTHIPVNCPVNDIFQINPAKWIFENEHGYNFSYNIVDIQGDQLVSTSYVIDESKTETKTSVPISYIEKEVSADIQVAKIKNNLCLLEKLNNIS